MRAVRPDECGDVDVGQGVAADHDERVVGQQVAKVAGAAGGAEQRLFEAVLEIEAERRAVAEVGADVVGIVVQIDADLGDAMAREQPQDVFHHRAVDDRRHRFGDTVRQWGETRAQAGRHDHRFGRVLATRPAPPWSVPLVRRTRSAHVSQAPSRQAMRSALP